LRIQYKDKPDQAFLNMCYSLAQLISGDDEDDEDKGEDQKEEE
jgi:hypothetical protein